MAGAECENDSVSNVGMRRTALVRIRRTYRPMQCNLYQANSVLGLT